jgi:glutathione S-transferase
MPVIDNPQSELILYTNPASRGQIARWMLEEVNADYHQIILPYGEAMKSEYYLKLNPMGKVPAIVHKGKVVTECAAICTYLADSFPQAKLAPPLSERHDYYRWLFFSAGPLEAAVVNKSLSVNVSSEQERMVGYGNYDRVLDVLSARLLASDFIAGNQFSAADVYVGSHVFWGLEFKSMEERPGFKAYVERLSERRAFNAAKQIDNELMAES